MILAYADIDFFFECDNDNIQNEVLNFFSNYTTRKNKSSHISFCIKCHYKQYPETLVDFCETQRITILNAHQVNLREEGFCFQDGYIRYVFNEKTGGYYVLNYYKKSIDIFNCESLKLVRDAKRVIRDILKVCVENETPSVMFHGALLYKQAVGAVVIMGDKGSGKTTLALQLAYKHNFIDCGKDKFFVELIEGTPHLVPWPTHYNLTNRTIMNFPQLKVETNKSSKDLDNLDNKAQLVPPIYDDSNLPIKMVMKKLVLLPPKESSEIQRDDLIIRSCYTPDDPLYQDWHNWGFADNKRKKYKHALKMIDFFIHFKAYYIAPKFGDFERNAEQIKYFLEGDQ